MFVGDLLSDLNIKKVDAIYLFVLIVFSLYITIKSINVAMNLNVYSDVLVYLTNALYYAGLSGNIHNTSTLYLSPVK